MSRNKEEIIRHTRNWVKKQLQGEGSGHDWLHIERVVLNTEKLLSAEGGDRFIAIMAALLHDIADHKLNGGNEEAGVQKVDQWLQKFKDLSATDRNNILDIVRNVSFRGAGVKDQMRSLEGKVVQDADRLDAMGAIGIARTFTFGGAKGREIYNPQKAAVSHGSFHEYKNSQGPTINHFHEKLLLLKDRMNTLTAGEIAKERHEFMQDFLSRFNKEIQAEL